MRPSEFQGLDSRFEGLEHRIDGINGKVDGIRSEMQGLRAELRAEIHVLDERLTIALDLRERIVAIETKLQG